MRWWTKANPDSDGCLWRLKYQRNSIIKRYERNRERKHNAQSYKEDDIEHG